MQRYMLKQSMVLGVLIVAGALFGARWGIVGVAIATLLALLVFYVLLYALTARVSGASAWSFVRAHVHPTLGFVIVLATAWLGRTWLLNLEWPPILVLIGTVALGILALGGATHVLKNHLWGDFLYQQGLAAFGGNAPASDREDQEDDDGGA